MTELTFDVFTDETVPLFDEPHAIPCRRPRLWTALVVTCCASLILWRIACTSLLLFQPSRLEFFTLLCVSFAALIKFRREWFWSDPDELPQRKWFSSCVMSVALLLSLHTGSIAATKLPPAPSETWNLANGVHVDLMWNDRGPLDCVHTLRVRPRSGFFQTGRIVSNCAVGGELVPIRKAGAGCVMAWQISMTDSTGPHLEYDSIHFSPSCGAVHTGL